MKYQLERELERYYGYSSFREGQKEIITDVLDGNHVLGILPTGSGKSLCYQLPARIVDGTVLVVSPLISLMLDQEKQLIASGFKKVISITSFLSLPDKQSAFASLDQYKLIYVSPEMLQNARFMEKLKSVRISLFVIDEAHCISQWGHEFRPDYLKLYEVIKQLNYPTVLALSATATPEVQKDIIDQLHTRNMKKHVYPMDRENISLSIAKVRDNQEKIDYLVSLLKKFPVPAMIYFSSRSWTEKVTVELTERIPHLEIAFYHGGMDQADRILIQQQFMNGQLDVVCCTSAFGMGINKSNIRLVVHFHLPPQIESYIQEIGRAGRDGHESVSLLLTAPNDELIPKRLIELELPPMEMVNVVLEYLKDRNHNRQRLPVDEEIIENLQLSEIQWRFLRFHLEKHGIIKESRILYNEQNWQHTATTIHEVIHSRKSYKKQKLDELLKWSAENTCRRKALFSPFQHTIKPPTAFCCDVCDFTFEAWQPIVLDKKANPSHWRETFKKLMLQEVVQGEINENYKSS
jgi:ATP-dependent DNA helicase RecQ